MTVEILPISGVGPIHPGDDLAARLLDAIANSALRLQDGDVLVVAQKVVSKAEGAVVRLPDDGADAHRPVVEREARRVLRRRGPLVITETSHGFVCANAGVDRSNSESGWAVLLPRDPDRSAHRLRTRVSRSTGVEVGVVITDSFGRAWRRGIVDVALGVAGLPAMLDLRGTPDMNGRLLDVTEVAVADEIASAAELVMGKARGIPAVVVRGLQLPEGEGRGTDLIRPIDEDLFR